VRLVKSIVEIILFMLTGFLFRIAVSNLLPFTTNVLLLVICVCIIVYICLNNCDKFKK